MSTDESGVKTSAVAEPEGTEPSQELPTLPPTTSSVLPPTPPQSSSEVAVDEPAACLSAEEVQKDTANKVDISSVCSGVRSEIKISKRCLTGR